MFKVVQTCHDVSINTMADVFTCGRNTQLSDKNKKPIKFCCSVSVSHLWPVAYVSMCLSFLLTFFSKMRTIQRDFSISEQQHIRCIRQTVNLFTQHSNIACSTNQEVPFEQFFSLLKWIFIHKTNFGWFVVNTIYSTFYFFDEMQILV